VQLAARRLDRAAGQEAASEMERARDNLVQAERTTARLGRLVGDLLDVAMLRSGHDLPMELEGLDLAELAGRVAEEHQPSSTRHRIVVGGSGAVVRSDRERLQRVLDNLVENAIKYSPDGGEIVIEVGSDADAATVVVRDHGMGIPADELEAVFEPYHRASNATTMRGIGLGLSGSRAVVHQLGGELTVESTEGSGSAFMMRLPRD
jgi:signal transduction histidine kinase